MKLVTVTPLVDAGNFTKTPAWKRVNDHLRRAIADVRWPPGRAAFTVNPIKAGNGVRPIKDGFVLRLLKLGWRAEQKFPPGDDSQERITHPGAFDASLDLSDEDMAPFVAEWETGNVASSHRSLNKMALAMLDGRISGGVLVLPTRALYKYLTDRVGNYEEIEPYFRLWGTLPIANGYLGVIAIEHDASSPDVPLITKGTEGRALV